MKLQKWVFALSCVCLGVNVAALPKGLTESELNNGSDTEFKMTPLPAYWNNEFPPEFYPVEAKEPDAESEKPKNLIIDGHSEVPFEQYAQYAEQPLIEFYNSATNQLMLFTSMQSFVAFAQEADIAGVQMLVEDEYEKVHQTTQPATNTKLAGAKILTASGFDTDESIWFMDSGYVRANVNCRVPGNGPISVVGNYCNYAPPRIWTRDDNFRLAWWAPDYSGNNSFVVTATPPRTAGATGFEDHVYFLQVPPGPHPGRTTDISNVCAVMNIFGCWSYWNDRNVRSFVMGPYADVQLISNRPPSYSTGTTQSGGVTLPYGRVLVKAPVFWQYCSLNPRCRTAFRMPDPNVTPGSYLFLLSGRYFPWQYFRLVPDVHRLLPGAELSNVRVTSYGRGGGAGLNNGETTVGARPGEPAYVAREGRIMAAFTEAASGCNTSIAPHFVPGVREPSDPRGPLFCAVPTAINSAGGSPLLSVLVPRTGQRASVFQFYTPAYDRTAGVPGAYGFNVDCSPTAASPDSLTRAFCPERFADPCRLINMYVRTFDSATMSYHTELQPELRLDNGTAVSGQQNSETGFDRCVNLYRMAQ